MLRKMMGLVLMVVLCGGVAFGEYIYEEPISVMNNRWTGPDTNKPLGMTGTLSGVTLDWNIVNLGTPSDPGPYRYTYTWSQVVDSWILEVSPGVSGISFDFSIDSGYTATVGDFVSAGTATLNTAITFTPTGTGGGKTFRFDTWLLPVYGDAYAGIGSGSVANRKLGVGTFQATFDASHTGDFANYLAMPDGSFGGGDMIIPEPSLSVLALTALLAGAVARRRKKEGEV